MKTILRFASIFALVGAVATGAEGQQTGDRFSADGFQYGPRNSLPPGQTAQIWNPARQKLLDGGPLIGGTVRAIDPRTYCAMASSGYDFIWVEKQHEAVTWEQTARMWRTCPGAAVPGARVAYADEREIQHAADMGALVIIVPTIDTVEEAQQAIDLTYFPPLGKRSSGGGQGPTELWNQVPGGYRQTWNDNVVLILMIETLEGVENARAIAKLPGVTGIFAATGDLANFSGYNEGDPQFEALVTEIETAGREAGVHLCGPLRWTNRPAYTCFQASAEDANIRRGAQAEIQQALEQIGSRGGQGTPTAPAGTASLVADLGAQCGSIIYEADCYAVVERAVTAAVGMPAAGQAEVVATLRQIIARNPAQAGRIREIAARAGLRAEL